MNNSSELEARLAETHGTPDLLALIAAALIAILRTLERQ